VAITQHGIALHHQHPRSIARAGRTQRDAGGGKFEVEQVGAHGQTVITGLDPAIHHLRKTLPKIDGYAGQARV